MNTTTVLVDDSIPLITLVRALASAGLVVRGDRRGGLLVTTLRAACTEECNSPISVTDGAGSAFRVRQAGNVVADRAESEPSPLHRDPKTPEGCGCETSLGEGPSQPLSDSFGNHDSSAFDDQFEDDLRADDDRQRAQDINLERRLLGL